MNKGKNQNSILVLATLGVYLGLVLAGATPTVWAQAATAKQFSVKDEAGQKDDLDNKPNDCDLLAKKVQERKSEFQFDENYFLEYATGLQQVLRAFFDLNVPTADVHWNAFRNGSSQFSLTRDFLDGRPFLFNGKKSADVDAKVLTFVNSAPALSSNGKITVDFSVGSINDTVVATSTVSRLDDIDAHKAVIAFDVSLDLFRCSVVNKHQKFILENTAIKWEGNNILIVTRLPRGSLDPLLASDAK